MRQERSETNPNDTMIHIPFVPVHEQIHRQAVLHPDRTAVICAGKHLSYLELDERSDRLARELIRRKIGKEELVAVLFERDAAAYVAEIAVLKAGAAFMPFIPEYPEGRIRYCMQDSGSRWLVTSEKLRAEREFPDAAFSVITMEELSDHAASAPLNMPLPQVSGEQAAYCIYTSGTTGRPKGVLIEHRNIANYVSRNEKSIDTMRFAEPGRISVAVAPFSFDFSLEEALVPLCNGNTVVIATGEQIHDPIGMAKLITGTGADALACTPTYLSGLLSVRECREALKGIRLFHIGAELFPRRLYTLLRELSQESIIMNVYGPTECTIISSSSILTDDEEITIGRPRANMQYYILDEAGNELGTGHKGELVIGGAQVARGYIGQSGAEGAFFVYHGKPAYHTGDLAAWTEKGEIQIFGRIDSQIKLHGYRIELNEIEAVMEEYPEIEHAAVLVKERNGASYMAGYYTSEETVDLFLLKRSMKQKLPDYMIPAVFIRLEQMPVSTNGKLDRRALPEPEESEWKARYIPPESEEEKKLCSAIEKVLHLPGGSVGLMDDFFGLSGDSISAMSLLAEAELDGLTYADIFSCRTPAEILAELQKKGTLLKTANLDQLDQAARGTRHMMTPVQRELLDVQLMVPQAATVSSIRFLMRFGEDVDADRFCKALNQALAHHSGFAMKFFFDDELNLCQQYDPSLIPQAEIHEISPAEEAALPDHLIRPFDALLNHSLCRVNLFHGKGGLYFFMDVHHLLADGLSIRPFLGSVVSAYHGRSLINDCYLAMLSAEEEKMLSGQQEADQAYLNGRYGGCDWCVMPFTPDPACGERGGEFHHRLRFDTDQMEKATERLGVSLSVIHLASILLAVYHFSGKKDVMAFWTFHNRQISEAEHAVGMFIKTLPVGCHMDEFRSVPELLLAVKEQVVSGVAHSAYSYLVEQVFPHGIPWIESNLQIHMTDSEMDSFAPEMMELHNAYSDTADNVMLAIITDDEHQSDAYDCMFTYSGRGIRAADVERLHREICENMEAIILNRDLVI